MTETTLYWKPKGKKPRALTEQPFATEEELEDYLCGNPELLGDVFIIGRQIRTGTGAERLDILGIDADGDVVIFELKNKPVDEEIVSQVLGYAIWVESNPDSIKKLFLQAKEQPEGIDIDRADLNVRIVVVAPSIRRGIARFRDKIDYELDLLEIKRIQGETGEIVVLNVIEDDQPGKISPAKGRPEYNKAFYLQYRNSRSVEVFYSLITEVAALVKKRKWNLVTKFNRNYCGFNSGFFRAFRVAWLGNRSLGLGFKLDEKTAKALTPKGKTLHNYRIRSKEAHFQIDLESPTIKPYVRLFEAAYENIVRGK
jgi:hypothetical protein